MLALKYVEYIIVFMNEQNKDLKEYIDQTINTKIQQSEKRMVTHFNRTVAEIKQENRHTITEIKKDLSEMREDNVRHAGALMEGFKDEIRIVVDMLQGVNDKTDLLDEAKADKREVKQHNNRISALEIKFS